MGEKKKEGNDQLISQPGKDLMILSLGGGGGKTPIVLSKRGEKKAVKSK